MYIVGHPADLASQQNGQNKICWFVPAGQEIWFSQGRTVLSQTHFSPSSTSFLVFIHPDHIIGTKVLSRLYLQTFGQSILRTPVRYLVLLC